MFTARFPWRTAVFFSACALAPVAQAQSLPACSLPSSADTPIDCSCPANPRLGRVWGSGPYTGDSDICTAALHAGVIGPEGGDIRITRGPGLDSYAASTENNVTTSSWGRYGSSFELASLMPVEPCSKPPADGAELSCSCDADAAPRSVWGSGPYTGDSDICTAARHAGAIGTDGTVTMMGLPGADAYQGSEANGVSTRSWGRYGSSFDFPGRGGMTQTATDQSSDAPICRDFSSDQAQLSCFCPADGRDSSVWGSGPYTSDSDICTAARHAGAIGSSGGTVHVLRTTGLPAYAGSEANGVATKGWGKYDSSFTFNRN